MVVAPVSRNRRCEPVVAVVRETVSAVVALRRSLVPLVPLVPSQRFGISNGQCAAAPLGSSAALAFSSPCSSSAAVVVVVVVVVMVVMVAMVVVVMVVMAVSAMAVVAVVACLDPLGAVFACLGPLVVVAPCLLFGQA